jgi:hypothetical protein
MVGGTGDRWLRRNIYGVLAALIPLVTLILGRGLFITGDRLWGLIWIGGGILMGVLLFPWPSRRSEYP